jgi:hypothetical protein
MDLWKARFLQSTAVLLQGGGAFLFVIAGDAGALPPFLMGVAASGSGLMLWGIGAQARVGAAPARPEPVAAPAPAPAVRAVLDPHRMEQMLEELQADVSSLREDREFFRQLYAARRDDRQQVTGVTADPLR